MAPSYANLFMGKFEQQTKRQLKERWITNNSA